MIFSSNSFIVSSKRFWRKSKISPLISFASFPIYSPERKFLLAKCSANSLLTFPISEELIFTGESYFSKCGFSNVSWLNEKFFFENGICLSIKSLDSFSLSLFLLNSKMLSISFFIQYLSAELFSGSNKSSIVLIFFVFAITKVLTPPFWSLFVENNNGSSSICSTNGSK